MVLVSLRHRTEWATPVTGTRANRLPFAGKSTLAQQLAEETGAALGRLDAINRSSESPADVAAAIGQDAGTAVGRGA